MRWWRRETPVREPSEDSQFRADEARMARQEAEAFLYQAKRQQSTVSAIAAALRRLRQENHFAEKVAETMRRRGDA
jgi:hypothetical protein